MYRITPFFTIFTGLSLKVVAAPSTSHNSSSAAHLIWAPYSISRLGILFSRSARHNLKGVPAQYIKTIMKIKIWRRNCRISQERYGFFSLRFFFHREPEQRVSSRSYWRLHEIWHYHMDIVMIDLALLLISWFACSAAGVAPRGVWFFKASPQRCSFVSFHLITRLILYLSTELEWIYASLILVRTNGHRWAAWIKLDVDETKNNKQCRCDGRVQMILSYSPSARRTERTLHYS